MKALHGGSVLRGNGRQPPRCTQWFPPPFCDDHVERLERPRHRLAEKRQHGDRRGFGSLSFHALCDDHVHHFRARPALALAQG
ncbi:hypothetical protein B4113_2451 [Geobacillus sp. B4113_201601]|nr:hypothetical protein B4113_2451 [Geobacillus sp. B4113_201601]